MEKNRGTGEAKPHWEVIKNWVAEDGTGRQLSRLYGGKPDREVSYEEVTNEHGKSWKEIPLSEIKILEEWQNNGRSYRHVEFEESFSSEQGTHGERGVKIYEDIQEQDGNGEWFSIKGKEEVDPRYAHH